jgi:hypothetical protein
MKTRMLLALAGLSARLITAAFGQDEVTPEIRQQIEALNQKFDEASTIMMQLVVLRVASQPGWWLHRWAPLWANRKSRNAMPECFSASVPSQIRSTKSPTCTTFIRKCAGLQHTAIM